VEAARGKVVVNPGLSVFAPEQLRLKRARSERPSVKGSSADSKRVLQALIRACAKTVNRNGIAFYAEFTHLVVPSVAVFWKARSVSPDEFDKTICLSRFAHRMALAGTIQLDQVRPLDLLEQELRRSPLTDHWRICSRLTPRLAQESAAQEHPSQLNRSGLGVQF
jgi:hypothetical protein